MSLPSISIVMAYHNRKELLETTIESINRSVFVGDIELCICDDGSSEGQRLTKRYLKKLVNPGVRIRLDSVPLVKKEWIGGSIPYNRALKLASNEIVLIQNPECWHYGDILTFAAEKLERSQWLSFACFHLDEASTESILNARSNRRNLVGSWSNHRIHRPVAYHFCASIRREDIERVGGFDERYGQGIAYDDDDLVFRLHRAGIEITCLDETAPFVCHLYHGSSFARSDAAELTEKNRSLFERRSDHANTWYLRHIPKHAFFYWGNPEGNLPFLNYLTLFSFRKFNPEWKMTLFEPRAASCVMLNADNSEEAYPTGASYHDKIESLGVDIEIVDLAQFGVDSDVPENFKGDIVRWHTLWHRGGLFSDMDILYFAPMNRLSFNRGHNAHKDTFISFVDRTSAGIRGHHSVGFLMSSRTTGGNRLFEHLFYKALAELDTNSYQSSGPDLMNRHCIEFNGVEREFGVNFLNMGMEMVYPFDSFHLDDIYVFNGVDQIGRTTIGLHWYGGARSLHDDYREFLDSVTADNYVDFDNTVTTLMGRVLQDTE